MFSGQKCVEPWFGFEYTVNDLSEKLLHQWDSFSLASQWNFALPPVNNYIPTNFSLCVETNDSITAFPTPPQLLKDEDGLRVWNKIDSTFGVPKAFFYVLLQSSAFYDSPRNAALTVLTIKVLVDLLMEESYMAHMGGLLFEASFEEVQGIEFRFEGFNQHLPKLVVKVFQLLRNFRTNPHTFEAVKEILVLEYKNKNMEVSEQSNYLRLHCLFKYRWPVEEILEQLMLLTSQEIENFVKNQVLHKDVHMECLMHGNIEADQVFQLIEDIRLPSILKSVHCPLDYVIELPVDSKLLHSCRAKNDQAQTSICEAYCQGPVDSPYNRACVDMVEQLVQEHAYDSLRTKQQLGYSVYTHMCDTNGVLGFCIVIESGHHNPRFLNERIEAFLQEMKGYLKKMAEGEFMEEKDALIQQKLQPCTNLRAESRKHWFRIYSRRYDFDYLQEEVEVLKKLKVK
eukprot:TRINITY_DN3660_c0_g1_i20.p1 TRINITY_DN3660_c0_g1~~TRINITY_DN3660_c0_g1_i20.p1  ORF type:complete len:455 (-),score=41.41 TRINITY_DN3660_c0_g1_i20:47-1411(-)